MKKKMTITKTDERRNKVERTDTCLNLKRHTSLVVIVAKLGGHVLCHLASRLDQAGRLKTGFSDF